jgi:hypothetical protein
MIKYRKQTSGEQAESKRQESRQKALEQVENTRVLRQMRADKAENSRERRRQQRKENTADNKQENGGQQRAYSRPGIIQ